MVTVFAHVKDVENPFYKEIDDVLNDIKNGTNKDYIEKIRSEDDKKKRNILKQKLRSICFSGEFSYRSAKNCIKHSGFACLDFDDVDEPNVLRDSLQNNEYIYSAFVSPSGNGVKALVKIPQSIKDHKKYYEAICETFDTKLDTATKDISRVCYESYDSELFINPDSKVWELKKDFTEVTIKNNYPTHFQIQDTDKKVDVIMKWFNKKFTLNVGERNNNLFKLACGLNRAGMTKTDCVNLFVSFYSNGLNKGEPELIVESAYKNTHEFNTLTLVDDNKIYEAERLLKKGVSKAKRELKKEGLDDDEIEDIIEFDFEDDYLIFWDTNKNGSISLNDYKFKLFLENRGYYKVQLNEKEFTFVKVYNNIINEVNETNIKDFILNYVQEIDIAVYNFFAKSTTKFTETYLNQLATKQLAMVRDTLTESYLFFLNKVIKVTEENIEFIDYINIGGFVWEDNIIKREFNITDTKSDFQQFIKNVSNQDEKRQDILESAIGYLLTTYKKQDEGLSVILYDETLNDNPSGRTGKTLVADAISELRKLVTLNGKEFDNKGNFPYDTISLDDNVICFDDMERKFKYETLFSIVTGNLTLKKKFQQPIVIPFERSPKLLFTSNYILSGVGDSHEDRKLEIELYRHYSKNFKPIDEFGKLFFSNEWTKDEWNAFYNYMISNIQKYFKNGLLKSELKTGKTKKLIANTCEDFYDFCENEFLWKEDKYYTTKEIMNDYNDGSREIPQRMNVSWFGRWLGMYFEFKQWKRDDTTYGGVRKFSVSGFESKDDNNVIDF
jgi:hypothetical protein